LNNIASVYSLEKQWRASHDRLTEAIRHQRIALKGNPRHPQYLQFLSNHLWNLAETCLALRNPVEAAEATREMVSMNSGNPERLFDAACYLCGCTELTSNRSDGSRYADEAMAVLKQAVAAGWNDAAQTASLDSHG